jgi:hypothetical protein
MKILQLEPPNLEFICKRYEINKFWDSKYKIRPISMIKIKSKVLSARSQGLGCRLLGQRVLIPESWGFSLQNYKPKGYKAFPAVRSHINSHD